LLESLEMSFKMFGRSVAEPDAGEHDIVLSGLPGVKVRATALHASSPWVLVGDDMGGVSIHDYQHSLIVFKIQPELHIPNRGGQSSKCTRVRHVVFLDANDAAWRGRPGAEAQAGGMVLGSEKAGAVLPPVCCAASEERLVLAVTESSVLLIDYVTCQVREVGALDARAVNALHVVPQAPASRRQLLFAAAGSDGIVRIVDTETCLIVRELNCGKKKASSLTHLVLFHLSPGGGGGPSGGGGGRVAIVAAAADGQLYSWTFQQPENLCAVAAGAEVTGMRLSVSDGVPRLVTLHSDKTLAIWHAASDQPLKEVARVKPGTRPKGSSFAYHALASVHLGHPQGVAWVAASAKDACLHLLHCQPSGAAPGEEKALAVPLSRQGQQLLQAMASSDKKAASKFKVYHLAEHPANTRLVSVSTSSGFAVLRIVVPSPCAASQLCLIASPPPPAAAAAAGPSAVQDRGLGGVVWGLLPAASAHALAGGGGGGCVFHLCRVHIKLPDAHGGVVAGGQQVAATRCVPCLAQLSFASAPAAAYSSASALPTIAASPSGRFLLVLSSERPPPVAKKKGVQAGEGGEGSGGHVCHLLHLPHPQQVPPSYTHTHTQCLCGSVPTV
jgi:WD40 repeat protein